MAEPGVARSEMRVWRHIIAAATADMEIISREHVADIEFRVSQAKPVYNPQRALSHELDNAALAAPDLSLEDCARSMSCGSRGASWAFSPTWAPRPASAR